MLLKVDVCLDYKLSAPCFALLQLELAAMADQHVLESSLELPESAASSQVPADEGIGERRWLQVNERLTCHYRARARVDRPVVELGALEQVPLHRLPGDAVKYLMPSRFCQSDLFMSFTAAEFGDLTGGRLVAAMRDWIEAQLAYVPGASDARTTAVDTFTGREGICRDFAHVMIAFARARSIPARMVSVYSPDVAPQDFHAVAEVYLGGDWHLVDATGMAQPDRMARIGVGRDAADIAFLTCYGEAELCDQAVMVAEDG